MDPHFFSFLCILQIRIFTTRFQVKGCCEGYVEPDPICLSKYQRIWSLCLPCEKHTHSIKPMTKFTTQSCFVKQPDFGND